jgi:cytochrome c oxidase subunit 2
MPGWKDISFQSSHSSIIHLTQRFHDYVLLILIVIIRLILVVIVDIAISHTSMTNFADYSVIEVWWTVLPGVVLVFIAYPSLRLLYLIDEVEASPVTVNTLGHQWFWEYNLPNYPGLIFESYMAASEGRTRLLDVDNRLTLPTGVGARVVVSSVDVIHAWTIPSIGVKVDAVPGRLNQLGLCPENSGVSYGQCSEICGSNHRFIPIVLERIPMTTWLKWHSWCFI